MTMDYAGRNVAGANVEFEHYYSAIDRGSILVGKYNRIKTV